MGSGTKDRILLYLYGIYLMAFVIYFFFFFIFACMEQKGNNNNRKQESMKYNEIYLVYMPYIEAG